MMPVKELKMTDDRLIRDTLGGDRNAFDQLVQRYRDRLYTAVVYFMGCPVEAEDVVQDAFVQAYRKLDTFHGHSQFYTWLYRIAIRRAISRRRRNTRQNRNLDADILASQSSTRDDPLRSAQRAEDAQQLRHAIAGLDEHHRLVVILRDIEGFDGPTTAEILNIPVGTVRSRLHRARNQLRMRLERTMALDN